MRVRLVRIGTSRGIRIPAAVLRKLGFEGEVDLRIRGRKLVLSRHRRPRDGWDQAFAAMARRGDDRLVHGEQLQASSDEEWIW